MDLGKKEDLCLLVPAAVDTGAGMLPVTSPTHPRHHHLCQLIASKLFGHLPSRMMVLMKVKQATFSSMNPFLGRERLASRYIPYPRVDRMLVGSLGCEKGAGHPNSSACVSFLGIQLTWRLCRVTVSHSAWSPPAHTCCHQHHIFPARWWGATEPPAQKTLEWFPEGVASGHSRDFCPTLTNSLCAGCNRQPLHVITKTDYGLNTPCSLKVLFVWQHVRYLNTVKLFSAQTYGVKKGESKLRPNGFWYSSRISQIYPQLECLSRLNKTWH